MSENRLVEDMLQLRADALALVAAADRILVTFKREIELSHDARTNLIVGCVASHYGFTRNQLMTDRSKWAPLVWARQVARFMVAEFCQVGSSEVGRRFACDHGTVMYAVKTVRNKVSIDPHVANDIAALRAELSEVLKNGFDANPPIDADNPEVKSVV